MLIQFLLWCMTGCLAFARVQHLGNLDFRQIRVFVFVLPVSSRELEVFATCNKYFRSGDNTKDGDSDLLYIKILSEHGLGVT